MPTNRLFIAEKPSLAKEIANALAHKNGVKASKDGGAWHVGDDKVAWLFGHMYETAPPQEYDPRYQQWRIDDLPIVPEKWKMTVHKDKATHVKGISRLMKEASFVVNAGDAGREGQLLVDEVLVENGWDPFSDKTLRLWVSSMALNDMIEALTNLLPNSDKRDLYWSAVCRQRADWLHGMNLTRLYSIRAKQAGSSQMVSVGRVQTPTLKLVVDRDNEIKNFKPVDHYLPTGTFIHENGKFQANWVIPNDFPGLDDEGRLVDKSQAEAVLERISGKAGKVLSYQTTDKKKGPPLPYALSSLQTECSAKLGLSAQQTLDVAQALYETHKVTTYPRSDSKYLPLSILKDEAPSILKNLQGVEGAIGKASGNANSSLKSGAWNDAKVSDHHAIIPTTDATASKIEKLSGVERKVFDLIAKAFIAQFYPDQRWKAISAQVGVGDDKFKANGRVDVDAGWKAVYVGEKSDDEDEGDDQALPIMRNDDPVSVEGGQVQSKRTTPPAHFTDGTLIAAMTNVHKYVADSEAKKRLKENNGLGTEATRANMIEKLISRSFLKRKGKNQLVSTVTGQSVISALPENLTDPALTSIWEGYLDRVSKGTLEHEKFMEAQINTLTKNVDAGKTAAVKIQGGKQLTPLDGHGKTCEKCGTGKMITRELRKGKHKGKKFLACDQYPTCDGVEWPKSKVDPVEGHGKGCPSCGKGKMETRKSAKGTVFLGCNAYPECKHVEFLPDPKIKKMKGDGDSCSKCGEGKMVTRLISKGKNKGKTFLSCNAYPKCDNSIWPD